MSKQQDRARWATLHDEQEACEACKWQQKATINEARVFLVIVDSERQRLEGMYLTCLVFARRGELVVGEVRSSDSGDTRRDWANGCIGLGSICGATGEGLRRRCSPDGQRLSLLLFLLAAKRRYRYRLVS